jgi:uncharacterized protein
MTPSTIVPPSLQQRLIERTRPKGAVVMYQRWEHLAFLHWRYDAATVQATLPRGLTVDTWNGSAWLGIVPVFMRDVRPRFVPAISAISDFIEINLRTYVYDAQGRPGLYFYSLDCDQPLAVETARTFLSLRYEHSIIDAAAGANGWVNLEAQRVGTDLKSTFRYRAFGPPIEAPHDSLDFFLIERYRLFTGDPTGEVLHSVPVCHAPYQIRPLQLTDWGDAPLRLAGFEPPGREPEHICGANAVSLEVFTPERVEQGS